jgi:hypothetical protein
MFVCVCVCVRLYSFLIFRYIYIYIHIFRTVEILGVYGFHPSPSAIYMPDEFDFLATTMCAPPRKL